MPTLSRSPAGPLHSLPKALPPLAWVLASGFCAWVVANLFWQLGAPPTVAAVAHHETDARKVAARIGLHVGRASQVTDGAPMRTVAREVGYTVTGIATGFGALPGFVILQADDGSAFSLSPGQSLPDGRRARIRRIRARQIGRAHV